MDYCLAGDDQPQTNKPNVQAGGKPSLATYSSRLDCIYSKNKQCLGMMAPDCLESFLRLPTQPRSS